MPQVLFSVGCSHRQFKQAVTISFGTQLIALAMCHIIVLIYVPLLQRKNALNTEVRSDLKSPNHNNL